MWGVRTFFAAVWPMVSALNRWQVGSQQNIGCFSPNPFYVWWLAWFQVPTPLPSQIFLRTSFCHFCQTAVWQRGQKTHRSIKFFLKVTQIIWDVWRPNSNKSQYHQFVWVLSSDLVQWLRYLLAISFLEVRKAEKAAPTPPTNATWLQSPDQPFGSSTPWSADCTLSSICANKRST